MKKKMFVMVGIILSFCMLLSGLTFSDLDLDEQLIVKGTIIDYDEEITEANFSYLEGISYIIVYEDTGYIIVFVDNKYVIVPIED